MRSLIEQQAVGIFHHWMVITKDVMARMFQRIALFTSLLFTSWCVMAITHEMGHIVGGTCSGGTLVDAHLWPWGLPYSIFSPDPHPLVTLWSGPLMGVAIPLLIAVVLHRQWSWFIANFCLLANGVYISIAWLLPDDQLDTTKLIQHGASPWVLLLYCILTVGFGYVGFRRSCVQFLTDRPKVTQTLNAGGTHRETERGRPP